MAEVTISKVHLSGELGECRKQLEALNERTHILLVHLAPEQLFWRPAEGSWSIGECVTHLTVTNRGMLPGIDASIEWARRKGLRGEGPFRHGWPGSWLVKVLEPPVKQRVRTSPWAVPRAEGSAESIETDYHASNAEVVERMRLAEGLHLGKAKVKSPFMPLLRYSLGQAFAIIAAHGRRHLWQAEQVRGNQAFPGRG
jgi:DinB superfamily